MSAIPQKTGRPKLRTGPAASYCGSTKSTFDKLRLSGGGPVYIAIGRAIVYDPDDLDAWLAKHRRLSTSAAVAAQGGEQFTSNARPLPRRQSGSAAVFPVSDADEGAESAPTGFLGPPSAGTPEAPHRRSQHSCRRGR